MLFDPSTYPIDTVAVPWGLSLAEAEARLPDRAWRPPYGGWPNLRGACQAVFGLAATEYNLRAPARHKPVLQVSYELAPPTLPVWPWLRPAYWVRPLTALLGPPIAAQAHRQSWNRQPGGVAYTAEWKVAAVRLSLSVYGGVRTHEGGPAAAGLFLDWEDELTAARPFYEAAQAQAAALEARAAQAEPYLFITHLPQVPFQMPEHGESLRHPAPVSVMRRQSQRALYREGLCETPQPLRALLNPTAVALWAVPGEATWAVSTYWDTVLLTPSCCVISLAILRPAKGSGSITLAVGDLRLSDSYGSSALPALAAAIEQRTERPVSRHEDYDC